MVSVALNFVVLLFCIPIVVSVPGKLPRLSPPELVLAFLRAVIRDFKSGCPPDVMKEWANYALTAPFQFKILENDEARYFASIQLRQDIIADKTGMALTPIQAIFDVAAFRKKHKGAKAKDIALLYEKHVRWAGEEDERPSSQTFCENAHTIYLNMLTVPAVCKLLVDAQEATKKNPLDKTSKLLAVCRNAATQETMIWCLEMLFVRTLVFVAPTVRGG